MIVTKQMVNALPITQKDKWGTPPSIYNPLNDEFNFTLDPCCEVSTALCRLFYTIETNGLIQDWQGESVYVNPPYSRGNIDLWMSKCYLESLKPNTNVTALIPVSTSAQWWHKYIVNKAEIRFVERRIKFVNAPSTAPFSSAIVVFGRSGVSSFKQRK